VSSLTLTRDGAAALDRSDPLALFRERFVIPDEGLVYLDGNSLGRLPNATLQRLHDVVESEWGARLIRGWWERWLELPVRVGDLVGELV
jgi:kynureninase